jgi:ElaB/YqjD/DUF883 family membrane-anchored ribosome-binding protein
MQPDESSVSGNDAGMGRLEDVLTPVRDDLEEAARELGDALIKAGGAVRRLREIDVGELMRRSPVAALSVAAGIGVLAGLCLWARRK